MNRHERRAWEKQTRRLRMAVRAVRSAQWANEPVAAPGPEMVIKAIDNETGTLSVEWLNRLGGTLDVSRVVREEWEEDGEIGSVAVLLGKGDRVTGYMPWSDYEAIRRGADR